MFPSVLSDSPLPRRDVRRDGVRLCSLLVVIGGCLRPIDHPARVDVLRPRPTSKALAEGCRGGEGNEVRLAAGIEADAPVVVLDEIHLHGVQPQQPMVALWPDGRVLFTRVLKADGDRTTFEHLQATIPPSTVDALVHEVARALA